MNQITYQLSVFERPSMGIVILAKKRLLFRLFTPLSRKNFKILFQPSLTGAKWYELSAEWEEAELETFMEIDNAISAMAFLRTNNKIQNQ